MEDKKTAFAVIICMFIFMFWFEYVMAPYKNQPAKQPLAVTQGAQLAAQNAGATVNTSPGNVSPANPSAPVPVDQSGVIKHPAFSEVEKNGFIVIDTGDQIVKISNMGARVASFSLKNYKAVLGKDDNLDLVVKDTASALPLAVYADNQNDDLVSYKLESVQGNANLKDGLYTLAPDSQLVLTFKGKLANSSEITKTYKFATQSFLFDLNVEVSGKPQTRVWAEWNNYDAHHEDSKRLDHNYFTLLGANNKITLVQLNELTLPVKDFGQNQWVSFGDKYFMTSLVSTGEAAQTQIGKDGNNFFFRLAGNGNKGDFKVFAGPKYHSSLAKTGYQLERNVDLGWFSFIALPLLSLLKFFYSILGNYGLAIVLLTLTIKTLFLPLTKTSFTSMKAMQDLQPEMKALKERIQDPTLLNKEIMGLYKKHGVNPMGGCLPMLIQLPVFLGLYNSLNYSIELRHAPFALWITDLSSPERLEFFGVGIPVMVLLMGASMLIQQITTPSAADPQQKKIMLMMPVVFSISFIIFPFPSGLVLYWLVNNLISIIQQVQLRNTKDTKSIGSTALGGTVIASTLIFGVAYILTLL